MNSFMLLYNSLVHVYIYLLSIIHVLRPDLKNKFFLFILSLNCLIIITLFENTTLLYNNQLKQERKLTRTSEEKNPMHAQGNRRCKLKCTMLFIGHLRDKRFTPILHQLVKIIFSQAYFIFCKEKGCQLHLF